MEAGYEGLQCLGDALELLEGLQASVVLGELIAKCGFIFQTRVKLCFEALDDFALLNNGVLMLGEPLCDCTNGRGHLV